MSLLKISSNCRYNEQIRVPLLALAEGLALRNPPNCKEIIDYLEERQKTHPQVELELGLGFVKLMYFLAEGHMRSAWELSINYIKLIEQNPTYTSRVKLQIGLFIR